MTISFSGLASGLDTSSWVESLVALKQAKIDTLEEEKETVLLSKETLDNIKSFFNSFRSMIEKVTDAQFGVASMDLFAQNLATSSNLDILTASATTEAEQSSYNIEVNQLATNSAANSNYSYMTTIVQTTTATADSKLINLGIKAGNIGVNVDGIERGITITENETIKSLIDKFKEIGVNASFNEKTGLFSVDISADDINDIGNTGIVEGLHLEGVNEGYESNELKISSTDTIFSAATEYTLLSDLGVKTGIITVEANDKSYNITIDANSTLGSLIEDFAKIDVLATLSKEGYLTISDAKITGEGTTNFTDALGLEFDVYSNSQTSGNLSHETIITQVTTATSDTLLSELGEGINITNGQTIIIKNSNNELSTITINQTTTLGMLLEEMTNAGLYANLNNDGTIEITGGTITGGSFDAIAALGLKVEPHSSMTTGKPLTETVEHFELVTMDTMLVDDLKVRAGYLEVTDANGNKFYEKIYHGQTLGDFMADLGNLGIYTKLRDDGVLEITGGAFATLSDDRVKQLIAEGIIRETDARYMQGSDILTALYGSPVISTDQITVASTYSKTQALTHKVTNTINASLTTTLGNLGLSDNGTSIFEVRGENRTINVSQDDSIQSLIDKLKNVGIEASWNSDTHKITIENAVINGGTSNLADVLNLTETLSGKYVTSNALSKKETITVDATEDTRLAEFGISNSMSAAERTINLYNSEGSLAGSITVNEDTTIGTLLDFINTHNNITSSFKDGIFVVDNGYIQNTVLENNMGLDTSNKSSFALGNSITITNVVSATATTKLDEIISFSDGTISVYNKDHTLAGTFKLDGTSTINEFFGALSQYNISATINDGIISLISSDGAYIKGDIVDALGIELRSEFITITSGTSNTSSESIKYLVTLNATMTDDFLLTTGMEKDREYNIVYNYIDPDKFSSNGNLGSLQPLHTYTVRYTDSDFIINGPTSYTISLDDTLTFAEFFNAFASSLGINGSIDDGIVQLDTNKDVYLTGDFITDVLKISPNSNTTITKTIGISNTGTSQSYLSVTQEVTTYSYKTVFHGTTTVTITTTAQATETVTITMTTTVGGGLTFPSLDSYWSDITGGGITKINLDYDGFTTIYTPGTSDTVRDFVDELNSIFPETTATIDENGVLTFHIKTTRLDGESQPANLTGSISFTSKDGTVWSASITSEPRKYVTTTIIPTSSTKLGTWREAKEKMTLTIDKTNAPSQTFTFGKEDTVGDVITALNEVLKAQNGGITLEDGKLLIKAEGITIGDTITSISGDIADMLGISIDTNDYNIGKIYPTTSSSEVYASDGTLYESDELLYTLFQETMPTDDFMVTISCLTTDSTAQKNVVLDLKTETIEDLISKLASVGITAKYENHKLTIGDNNDTAIVLWEPNGLLGKFNIDIGSNSMMSIDKELDITKEYVDAKYECNINMSAGIIDNGDGYIDYITGTKTITISTTATGSKTITVDITATCTATQTVPVTVTEMMTLDSSFAQLGMWGSSEYINVMYEGTEYTITITSDNTVWDMVSALGGYGISAIIHNGAITIQGTHNGYITSMSSGVKNALGMNSVYQWSETRPYQNYTYLGSTLTIEETRTLTTGTTLSELGFSGIGTISVNYEDNSYTVTFKNEATIDDIITSLAGLGINGYVLDGRLTLRGTKNGYITNISSNLQTALKLKAAGNGNTWTTTVNEICTNTNSDRQTHSVIANMDKDTLLSDIGITGGNILITQQGVNYTVNVDTTKVKTVSDFMNFLAQYGFNSQIDADGRLVVTGIGESYLTSLSGGSNILDVFGLKNWNMGSVSQASNKLNDKKTIVQETTLDTKLNELTDAAGNSLGITSGNIYVYQDGTRYLVNINNNDTIKTLAAKLSQYGIIMELSSDGKLYFEGNNNSYMTTNGISSGASNILQKLNILNNWSERYDSTSDNLSYTVVVNNVVNNSTKLSDLQDETGTNLGITEGTFYIYNNGVRSTATITADMTVNDLKAMLAEHGLIVDISENGEISVGAYGNTYLASSALAGQNSNIVSTLFAEWDFVNIYTSNGLTIPKDVIKAVTRDTKLSDINEGTYQDGFITVVKDGIQTNIELTADDTIGTLMDQLALYGFESVLNENGQLILKNTGNSLLQKYTGTGQASNALELLGIDLNNWIQTNTYESETLNVVTTTTIDSDVTRDTLLAKLGVTTGEYYIYNNGVKYTAYISTGETMGSFLDTLKSFGIETSLVSDGDSSILTIIGSGDSYITKSNSTTNASNVVEKLFGSNNHNTSYKYEGLEQTSTLVTTFTAATEDTLLSYFNKPWGSDTLKAEGSLAIIVNGENAKIEITENETFGSLIKKFEALGLEASMTSDGQLIIQSGFDTFTIDQANTDSSIMATIGLQYHQDLGGFAASSETTKATTTQIEEKTLSVANYAGYDTKMGLLNISDGTLSIYKNGEKATIQIKKDETFGDLRSRISAAFSDVDLTFEDGYLKIFSKNPDDSIEVGATTDTSNFAAITGISSDGKTVSSARELYCVNSDSVIMNSGLFRRGDVTEGTFIVGDATFSISNTTTLAGLISQINSNDAANATAYWDSIDGKLVIKSRTTGSALINIEAGTSNFTDIMGYTNTTWAADGSVETTKMNVNVQDVGNNAKFSINGTYYTSNSNTITSDISRIKGLTINLKGLTEDSAVTLTVERDKETLANAVSDIVDSYNELMKNVDEAISKDGKLHDQSVLKLVRNQLRNMMTSSDAGTTVFRNLDAIGIKVENASANNISTDNITTLTFDKDKFIQAYEADEDALKALLIGSDSNTGIFTKVETLIESSLKAVTGYFATAEASYDREVKDIENKIDKQKKALDRYRAQLEAKFASMDILIANMQQQYSSFLTT